MSKPLKILITTTGVSAARMIAPVAIALRQRGHQITLVTDGHSKNHWEYRGFPKHQQGGGSEELVLGVPAPYYSVGFEEYFKETRHRPDIILSGLTSSLIVPWYNSKDWLEEVVCLEANRHKIPLIQFECRWAANRCSNAIPQVIVTLDDFSQDLIHKEPRLTDAGVWQTGNPAVVEQLAVPFHDATSMLIRDFEKVGFFFVLLIQEGPSQVYGDDALQITLESLAKTASRRGTIIPRFDATYSIRREDVMRWYQEVQKQARRYDIPVAFPSEQMHPTADLARTCAVTVSTSSPYLMFSAAFNKIPVSVLTPQTKRGLQNLMPGVDRHPLVTQGVIAELQEAEDLSRFLQETGDIPLRLAATQQEYFKRWWDPLVIAERIEDVV